MRTKYEVHSGRRLVSLQSASTATEAVIEYLCSVGCRTDEIMRLSVDTVSWRGAVYRAVPLDSD